MKRERIFRYAALLTVMVASLAVSGCGSSVESKTSSSPNESLVKTAALTDYFVTTDSLASSAAKTPPATAGSTLLLVDVRAKSAYDAGHIPGAINIPSNEFVHTREDGVKYILLPQDRFIEFANRYGITRQSDVIAYADDTNSYAGRLVWTLNYYGHTQARTLDGGITKWKNEGRPLETTANAPTPATGFTITGKADILALAGDVQTAIGKPGVVLFDTRSEAEYKGTQPLDLYRPGHLPGAVWINWLDLQKTDSSGAQVLKSRDELLAQLYARGITPDKLIINYCEGGIRSGYVTNVLRGLGYPRVKNYDGSWNEWGKFSQKDPDRYPVSLESQQVGVGYVIDTNAGPGGAGVVPGVTLIDRAAKSVIKSIRFTDQPNAGVGHFANVTADGSELWLCSNYDGTNAAMNVYDTAAFRNISTVNATNRSRVIKYSFPQGCGVQSVQSPNGRFLFASVDQGTKGVNVFDIKNHAYLGRIDNSATAPHVGVVSADNRTYYTTTGGKHTVVAYDISGLPATVPTYANKLFEIDLGYGSLHAVRLHPNGRYLFVGNNKWPVPSGVSVSTSGTNVIDLVTRQIIATIPGRPHNYAISLDGRYLLSTELSSPDCEVSLPGDPGNRLQFIDISTLLTADPDPAKIRDIYHFDTPGHGGSHAGWDTFTGLLYYSVYDTNYDGWLYRLDTGNLSAATPGISQVGDKLKIGRGPHGVSFPGINGD